MDNRGEARVLYFAVWARQDTILAKMKPLDMMEYMVGRRVINFQERKTIDTEGRIKGDARYNKLLINHLMKKDQVTPGILSIFMEGLWEKKQNLLAKLIEEKMEEFKIGPTDDFFNNLRKLYVDLWTTLAPVPTDQFVLNLIDRRMFMDPNYTIKIKDWDKSRKSAWGENDRNFTRYRAHQVSDFEKIFQYTNRDKDNPRLVLIKGDPGVGKTTLCRFYTIKWAMSRKNNLNTTIIKDSPIAHYKVVFYLPLSSFGKHDNIVDMLLDPHMKYFNPWDRYLMETFLDDPSNMDQSMFILDGLDDITLEKDSQLSRLITGELYPEAKVIVCSRPYSASLTQIKTDPDLIVNVSGFDKKNATKFIQAVLCMDMPKERYDFLDHKCLLLNTDLHLNPLCLNLMCFIFQNHLKLGKLPEDFDLPQTRTSLFNAYFKMLLRLHLKKWNRIKEECFFIKNPLSQDADIPSDLKHIIYVMSRLSFLALANEKYDFTEEDLQVNLLSSKTLKDIGLVCDISSAGDKRYFFRHKMLAEHLAGIYLSMEGFRVPEYTKRLEKGDKVSLSDRLGTFHNMVAFAAGVSSVFFRELCKSATEHCIIKGLPDKDTFLHPQDAVIFLETQDPTVADAFAKYLLDAQMVSVYEEQDIDPTVYEWAASLFFVDSINFHTICDLFEQFYHLKLYPREMREDEETESRYEECVKIETVQKRVRGKYRNYENIDFQQCGLLFTASSSVMIFQNIKSIIIDDGIDGHSSAFLQLRDVVYSFPNVEEVELRRVNLYSTEHRIGYLKDLLGELDIGDLDIDDEEQDVEDGHPIRTIAFDQIHPNATVVRDIKSLQNIETVQVMGSQIPESGFEALAAAIKATPRMKSLGISGNNLGWSAMALLQALALQPELEELYLANCSLKDAAEPLKTHMAAGTINRITSLQKLDISDNSLTHRQFPVIDYFTTGNLKVLKLSGNHFGAAAVQVLDSLASHDTITDLHMNDCALDSAVEPLQEALNDRSVSKLHNLKKLQLRTNWLESGIVDIIDYFCTNKITVLHLSENPLGESAVDMFYVLAEMGTIVELHLDNCNLDDAVVPLELATATDCENRLLPLTTLQTLNLSDNGLKYDCAPLLTYFITKKVKYLDMSLNPLGAATVFLLDRLSKYDNVRDLNMKNCDLQSAVEPLKEAIEENAIQRLHRLKLVNVSGNFLEYVSKGRPNKTFEEYFSTNEKLKYIKR